MKAKLIGGRKLKMHVADHPSVAAYGRAPLLGSAPIEINEVAFLIHARSLQSFDCPTALALKCETVAPRSPVAVQRSFIGAIFDEAASFVAQIKGGFATR
jgi:hypothetical protein